MLVEKNNKCCITIVKGTNNLRQKTNKEDTYRETEGVLAILLHTYERLSNKRKVQLICI